MTDNAPDDQQQTPIEVLKQLPVDPPKAGGDAAFTDGDHDPYPVPDGPPGQ